MRTFSFTTVIITAVVLCGVSLDQAYAQSNYRGRASRSSSSLLKEKFSSKQRMLIKNKEKLGLSDDQVARLEQLKANLEKGNVMKEAQIQVIDIDLRSMLAADVVDLNKVNQLIDAKFEFEKARVKEEAQAYAELKSILDPQQRRAMKNHREIYRGPYNRGAEDDE